jgi:pimeloyl-ACP methyl ester carboxylesterase
MKQPTLLLTFLLLTLITRGQAVYHFTQGLAVASGSQYGREAIYTDPLAWQLYNDQLRRPSVGAAFGIGKNGDTLTWKEIKADSLGRFHRVRGGGRQGATSFGNPGYVDRGVDYLYLSYTSDREKTALLHIQGNSGVFVNGAPHTGDPYESGWLYIPIVLHKGINTFYIRGTNVWPELIFPARPVFISTPDSTLPSVVLGAQNGVLQGAVVVVNTSGVALNGYVLKSEVEGKAVSLPIPVIPARATRKVIFSFDAGNVRQKGHFPCRLSLLAGTKEIDSASVYLDAVDPSDHYSSTFVSAIDGSLQYYAVAPQSNGSGPGSALFLSVHGAGVEAIGQARAYRSKDWGTLVAATNRRPRGFNWEDWGRLDALEVLDLAVKRFSPDPTRIYLTGHSMGGHGTWFLGATYPDKWAAIGACSGYPTLKEYGSADGKIPDSSRVPVEQVLLRAGNQSDVLKLAYNYRPMGVYILHGDSDKTVPVLYAREMRQVLGAFHPDFSYHEVPGAGHWYGNQSEDWDPLFAFFKWHTLAPDSAIRDIDFTTSSPGISATYRWASVIQQIHPLGYSRILLHRSGQAITGTTDNVAVLRLALGVFGAGATVDITLNGAQALRYTTRAADDTIYLSGSSGQLITPPAASEKGPSRYGTFKEAFNHRMLFVYGTRGSPQENAWSYDKALFDAETWYYRGNGSVDLVADKAYDKAAYRGRNIILYGNAATNGAWNGLLGNCPIRVEKNTVSVGTQTWQGNDLGAYFVWPQDDDSTCVGVVTGTGIRGMQAANANQYFAGGSGFPDYMIFKTDMLKTGSGGILAAGFFDNQWKLVP